MSSLQRLGRTFATDATIGDLGSELFRQGSNYARRKLVRQGAKGAKKLKDYLKRKLDDQLTPSKNKKKKTLAQTKRIMPKSYAGSTTNMLAGRAAMKKSGKIKNIKKGKKVKVPAKLRNQVKEVLKGGQFTGTYNTVSQGTIGLIGVNDVSSSTTLYVASTGVYSTIVTADVSVIPTYTNTGGPAWVYWGAMFSGPASATLYNNQFEHFSPMQFLDAASKLWNNKYGTGDSYYVNSSGNIRLDVIKSTGAPTSVSLGATGAQNAPLKLNIVNSYAKYTLKNNSLRSYKVEIFHCTPKLKFPVKRALTDLFETVTAELGGVEGDGTVSSGVPIGSTFLVGVSSNTVQGAGATVMQHIDFDPKDSPQWRSRWNYQKVTIAIAAGETCEHSIQGPRNTLLDFSKITQINAEAQQTIPTFCKGYSASVFMRVLPDMVTSTDAATYNFTGNFSNAEAGAGSSTGQIALPIAVQVQQGFAIKVPEQVGFIQKAVAAGEPQWLNMNRKIKRFDTLCGDPASGIAYSGAQEENPTVTTVKTVFS